MIFALRGMQSESKLRGGPERNGGGHCGSATWGTIELECSVQLERPLAHVDQTQTARFSCAVWVETNAVVGDGKANLAIGAGKPDINVFRSSMFGGVAHRFLGNAVETQRGAGR